MNTENITRVRRLDLNTVLYSGSAYQSQGSSAAGHWIISDISITYHLWKTPIVFGVKMLMVNVTGQGSLLLLTIAFLDDNSCLIDQSYSCSTYISLITHRRSLLVLWSKGRRLR